MKNKTLKVLDKIADFSFRKGGIMTVFVFGLIVGLVFQVAVVFGDYADDVDNTLDTPASENVTPLEAPNKPLNNTIPQFIGLQIYDSGSDTNTKPNAEIFGDSGNIYTKGVIKSSITTYNGAAISGWNASDNSAASGVYGKSFTGVFGESDTASGYGVKGVATGNNSAGVYAKGKSGSTGVYAEADGSSVAIKAIKSGNQGYAIYAKDGAYTIFGNNTTNNNNGIGVWGLSKNGIGVKGETSSNNSDKAAIFAKTTGSAPGIISNGDIVLNKGNKVINNTAGALILQGAGTGVQIKSILVASSGANFNGKALKNVNLSSLIDIKSNNTFTLYTDSVSCTDGNDVLISCMGKTENPSTESLGGVYSTGNTCTVTAVGNFKVKAKAICLVVPGN